MGLRVRLIPALTRPGESGTVRPRGWWILALALPLLLGSCNPVYVARAGWAQAGILSAREPIPRVLTHPDTDPRTAGKLRLIWDARQFAIDELAFQNAGDSYTSYVNLPSDTLALVITAAHRDRLAFRTWWFPITGRVPYRAYFSESGARRAESDLQAEGFDTRLRPVAAFSTLGWFSDPVYSTLLGQDEVGVVETVLHELAHNHLFLPGQGRFNESWATFAGHAASIEFFCRREGGGPDTRWCLRARDRWDDMRTVGRLLETLEGELGAGYAALRDTAQVEGDDEAARVRQAARLESFRAQTFGKARDDFATTVQPALAEGGWRRLADEELNNATLMALTLYMHRLDDFHRTWLTNFDGDLAAMMTWVRDEATGPDDPFQILPIPKDESLP